MVRPEHTSIQRRAPQTATPGHLAQAGMKSAGSPLPVTARKAMEARFGHDFGSVRIHADDTADGAARSLEAKAYTVGTDLVFQSDAFNPHTAEGEELLAHELTHVVQQSASGPVGSIEGLELSEPGDAAEREADTLAEDALGGEAAARE